MEILNEILLYIVTAFEAICFSYGNYVFYCIVTKSISKRNIKSIFINAVLLFTLFAIYRIFLCWFLRFAWIKPFINIIALTIITKVTYKQKWLQCFFCAMATMLLSAILELFVAVIINLLGIIPEDFLNTTIATSLSGMLISIVYFLVSYLTFVIYKKKYDSVDTSCDFSKYLLPQFITIAACLIPSMAMLMKNNFEYSAAFILINIIQLAIISIVSIYNMRNCFKQKETELKLENTITHNQTLIKVNEGVRGFKHDMGNIVQAILGYIALNDAEGAKAFCQNLVLGFNDINVLSILSPKVINDPAIYGVVVNKILIAREKNMELTLDINTDISKINFPKFELSRILGILIDNAIEAGINTDSKKLILNVHTADNELYDEITISNSITSPNIPLDKIFNKDFSSKKNPSGFGLYEVKNLIDKFNQSFITTNIDAEKMMFTQNIKIFRC